jgi:hypothetical protein
LTNSIPFEKYAHYFTHLLSKLEYGFAVDTYTFGMSPMLGKVLQEVGYSDIHMKSYVLDFSYDTAFHPIQVSPGEMLQYSAAMYPVGKMSERNSTCSSVSESGTGSAPTSAYGTRTNSAWPPG